MENRFGVTPVKQEDNGLESPLSSKVVALSSILSREDSGKGRRVIPYHLLALNKQADDYYRSFFFRLRIISSVIFSRSYSGFQPHSLRAQLSSILSGQLSAMACLMGSGS